MLDAARGIAGSSMVTAMARNGVDFGIQLAGTGDRWFTGAGAGASTACISPAIRTPTPRRTSATARSPRPPASADSPWRRRRRSSSSSAARRTTRSPTRARWAHITLGQNSALHAAGHEFRGHAGRHRRAQGGRYRNPADHQHRHRASRGGRRPDRRRHHARAARLLHAGGRCACAEAAPERTTERVREERHGVGQEACGRGDRRQRADPRQGSSRRSPTSTKPSALTVASYRRHDRGRLERHRHARQRPADGLHPAPLGTVDPRGGAGADGLRRRRPAGRDRLHVRQGVPQRIPPPRHRAASRSRW